MATHPSAIEEAERAGLDISQLELNLSYSYEQRVILHQQALDLLIELEEAGCHVVGRLGCAITLADLFRAKEAILRSQIR